MRWISLAIVAVLAAPLSLAAQARTAHPTPKLFVLDSASTSYREILGGPPATVTMRSGHVVLAPGASVGQHSTEHNEEVVIVFSGSGELRIAGGKTLALRPGAVAYSPPETVHNVVNTGTTPLRYLYVVSRAR